MLPETQTHAPEVLGGVLVDGKVKYGIPVPNGASLLSGYTPGTEVKGLNEIPAAVRPPDKLISIVHLSFDVMIGTGFALLGLAFWYALAWWRRRDLPRSRWFYRAASIAGLVSIVSLETGWVVTEVGRQPWTVTGLLLTTDAVTTTGNIWPFFIAVLLIYAAVGVATILVLRSMRRRWATVDVPYGPSDE
jgi:cytochrome d ubiquinol oxidase subunit I